MCACLWAFVSSRLGEWQGCQLWGDGGHRIGFPFYYVWLLFVHISSPEKWGNYDFPLSLLALFDNRHWPRSVWQSHARRHGIVTQWHIHVWFCRRRRLFLQQTRTDSIQKVCGCIWQSFVHFTKLPKVYNIFLQMKFFYGWKSAQVKKF